MTSPLLLLDYCSSLKGLPRIRCINEDSYVQAFDQMSKSAGRRPSADQAAFRRHLANKQPAVWVVQRQRIAYLEALLQRAPGPGSSRELNTNSHFCRSRSAPQAIMQMKRAHYMTTPCHNDTLSDSTIDLTALTSTPSSCATSELEHLNEKFSSGLEDRLLEQALEEWHSLCQSCDSCTAL